MLDSCTLLIWRILWLCSFPLWFGWPWWSWSYGRWIYNYLCNQFLSPLK